MIPHRVPRVLRLAPARLTAGLDHCRRLDLPAHRALHGEPARRELDELIELAEEVDLRGRGGAAFPFARKLRAVAPGERVVLVNAVEGEPASAQGRDAAGPHPSSRAGRRAAGRRGAAGPRGDRRDRRRGGFAGPPWAAALEERRAATVSGAAERYGGRMRVVGLPERFITGEGGALVRGVERPGGRPRRTQAQGGGGGRRRAAHTAVERRDLRPAGRPRRAWPRGLRRGGHRPRARHRPAHRGRRGRGGGDGGRAAGHRAGGVRAGARRRRAGRRLPRGLAGRGGRGDGRRLPRGDAAGRRRSRARGSWRPSPRRPALSARSPGSPPTSPRSPQGSAAPAVSDFPRWPGRCAR
ncbi:hypothetical protein [Nonomuraea dietziae]|uniref:hypothetical protein n=1 Tax=Nonomuraea dietziae TaxID=65515 RepID=UPI0031DCF4AA